MQAANRPAIRAAGRLATARHDKTRRRLQSAPVDDGRRLARSPKLSRVDVRMIVGDDDANRRMLIDTSTPESLERDFHAWLKGELRTRVPPTSVVEGAAAHSTPTTPSLTAESSPLSTGDGYGTSGFGSASSSTAGGGPSPPPLPPPPSFLSYPPSFVMAGARWPSDGVCAAAPSSSPHPPAADSRKMPRSTATQRNSGINQLGRAYNPGLPLSIEERQHIVSLYTQGWKICDVSKHLQVTHSCVSKILNRFRHTGSVRPKDAKERSESSLVVAIREYRSRFGLKQSEIRDQLIRDGHCHIENAPSRSSINHILRTKVDSSQLKRKLVTP